MKLDKSQTLGERAWQSNGVKIFLKPLTAVLLMVCDALMVMLAFVVAHSAYMFMKVGQVVVLDHNPFVAVACLALLAAFLFWNRGHYIRRIPVWDELYEVVRVLSFLALLNIILVILINSSFSSALRWAMTWIYAFFAITASRIILKKFFFQIGIWDRPALIVGTGQNAHKAYQVLSREKLLGYNVLAFIDLDRSSPNKSLSIDGKTFRVVSFSSKIIEEIKHSGGEIFVALESEQQEQMKTLVKKLRCLNERLHVITPLWGLPLAGMAVSSLFSNELSFMSLKNNLGLRHMRSLKRLFDLICAILLLIFLSPLFLLLIILVKTSSPGPVFYGHERVGRQGRLFKCYKFRTMVIGSAGALEDLLAADPVARAEWERDFKLKNDPRITKIGKFLRDYSLDELPQLLSVLVGDMSLVGPRPIVQDELERYRDDIDYYLEVRPGITGIWQVSGRSDVDYSERVTYDVWYVKNWMLWYDIVILLKTFGAVLGKKGAY